MTTGSTPPILLILGAGPNVGFHVAQAFSSKGYKVALASRSGKADVPGAIHIPVDLSKPEAIPGVFEKVRQKLGGWPSVVVYNGAKIFTEPTPDPLSSPSLTLDEIRATYNTNTISPQVAAQCTVEGFKTLDQQASKTFIYTGNILNLRAAPGFANFGASKGAMGSLLRNWAEFGGYEALGITFYYADERDPTGRPMYDGVSGQAAGNEYVELAERRAQGPWNYTYVDGKGFVDFGMNPPL